jgi:hypothetical protein
MILMNIILKILNGDFNVRTKIETHQSLYN